MTAAPRNRGRGLRSRLTCWDMELSGEVGKHARDELLKGAFTPPDVRRPPGLRPRRRKFSRRTPGRGAGAPAREVPEPWPPTGPPDPLPGTISPN
ncbi:hypothetical protein GCM10010326_34940 [Streptomyces xanthochromogenes]|uniref:Uncharacterized protein n=1 Tax=Streptomyces xanthochromogenes TaxID=67384 RepID=A0ABQ3A9J9_9ACTN|nr:hypothetical protein GCM10010326_34940 [Streptomyces xanthochromogenes]